MTANSPPDSLMHELIETVKDNTDKTIAVRNDVNRAMAQLYQDVVTTKRDIVIIKQQLEAEARERPARQNVLDWSIKQIKDRLDGQDDILEGQDQKLDTLFDQQQVVVTSGQRRFWLMVAILLACLFVAARVALVWFGVV